MTKKFKLNVPVFTDAYITVVFTDNYAAFVKKNINQHFNGEESADAGAYFCLDDGREYLVFDIAGFKEEDTICHDSFHAVAELLRSNDIPLSRETEETYAYTLEFIFSKVNKQWKKVKLKINGDGDRTNKSKSGQVLPNGTWNTKSGTEA